MDLANDLTNDLFQKFPLKSKKIDNDHFVLLKANIFLTLPGLPMPSATRASFIHKSLLLRLRCVALRKEAWACSLKHLNLLLYSPTRHWTTHIHPCGPMSLVSLVTSSWSVLMTRASNNLHGGKRFFKPYQNEHNLVKEEKGIKVKKHVQLTQKFPWKSRSATHPHFLPSNSTILKAFLETSPIKMKPK